MTPLPHSRPETSCGLALLKKTSATPSLTALTVPSADATTATRVFVAAAAESLGLDRETALTAASHGLADGIMAWREGKFSLDGLLHEAATPGGISAATLAATDKAGYQRAVQAGLRMGMNRARKNAK